MKYPECPGCGYRSSKYWNGVICLKCGHDVSEYDKSVLPGYNDEEGGD